MKLNYSSEKWKLRMYPFLRKGVILNWNVKKCFINLILIGLRQSKENNTECGGAFQRVISCQKMKRMMTRKSFGLFQLIWLRLNIQFVEKLSLKVIDWQIMIFTQKCIKMYELQAYMHIDMACTMYILKSGIKKCGIYQTTNILKRCKLRLIIE